MKTTNRDYTTAAPVSMIEDDGPAFVVETVRVVRGFDRVPFAKDGKISIGEYIDATIRDAMHNGEELQDIAVHFEKSDWTALSESFAKQR